LAKLSVSERHLLHGHKIVEHQRALVDAHCRNIGVAASRQTYENGGGD
jgi:hypothetical protein